MTGDELWWDGFALPIVDGFVVCAAVYDGRIVIGGRFDQVGGIRASNIAQWDGSRWGPLRSGTDGAVMSLLAYQADLIVGGFFAHAGGKEILGVASWDGSAWSSLGPGLDDPQHVPSGALNLGAYRGELIAVGDFTRSGSTVVRHVARWDGSAWSPLGTGLNGAAQTISVFQDVLFAGGSFDSAGAAPAPSIAKWDGEDWSGVGSGLARSTASGQVRSLVVHGNKLVAGGEFDAAGDVPARNVAAWDGVAWDSLGAGVDGIVFSLVTHGGVLFVGGSLAAGPLAEWDGGAWLAGPPGVTGHARCLLSYGDDLIVGGVLSALGPGFEEIVGFGVVRWTGQTWRGFESWTNQMHGLVWRDGGYVDVSALAAYRGGIVATGVFQYAGDPPGWSAVGRIAQWDGDRWRALPPWPANGVAQTLLSTGDTLYAGGAFYGYPGFTGTIPVLRYDGTSWTPLDTLSLWVRGLVVYQGSVYAGGTRLSLSDANRGGVYRWNGDTWREVGALDPFDRT